MNMIYFECDYQEGAHPLILERLVETNMVQTAGYSEDVYCDKAKELIKSRFNAKQSDVHFLVGGTQTNMTFIASVLRPHQGVISAESGHINVHETGAIEATGHKVLTLPSVDGKITATQVNNYYNRHWSDASFEHIVQPGMVYISLPTENGTMYTRDELTELYDECKRLRLPLYIDGARLGYGLSAPVNDIKPEDLPLLCDAFYIGGTKQGALFGEALVINNEIYKRDFRYLIKQRGGLLAKGRLLGLQFIVLFEDDLYMRLSERAVNLANMLRTALSENGIEFMFDSYSNQQFPILTKEKIAELRNKYAFYDWAELEDGNIAVRFCTSWATKESDILELINDVIK